jgi:hypothetical protein
MGLLKAGNFQNHTPQANCKEFIDVHGNMHVKRSGSERFQWSCRNSKHYQ